MARRKIQPTIEMNQQEFFDLVDGIRKAGTPEYRALRFKDISDLIEVNRGELFQLLGLRKKPSNRDKTTIQVPHDIEGRITRIRERIEGNEIELKYDLTPERQAELDATIESIQTHAFTNYRKRLSIKTISKLARIPHSRLESALKPCAKKRKKGKKLDKRTLANHDIDKLLELRNQIVAGTIEFVDRHNFQSGRDKNEFRIIVTKDDIAMLEWLRENSGLTYQVLEQILGLPKGKLSRLSAEVKRENRNQHPRLDVKAINELIFLVEKRIEEIKGQYAKLSPKIEPDDGLELAMGQITDVQTTIIALRPAVDREMKRKKKASAA